MAYFVTIVGTILSIITYYSTEIKFFMWLGYIFGAVLGMMITADTIKIEKEDDQRDAEIRTKWQLAVQQRCMEEKRRKRIAKQKINKAKRGY